MTNQDFFTVDAHIDTPRLATRLDPSKFTLDRHSIGDVDFPRMRKGKLKSAVMVLYLPDHVQDRLSKDEVDWCIAEQLAFIRKHCEVVTTSQEAFDSNKPRRLPVFLAVESGRLIHNSLDRLRTFALEGVRYLTLTHNRNTEWAGSATDTIGPTGLTAFGKTVVRECNRLNILVDVSHASDETAIAAIECSGSKVIASHSGCRTLLDHPRNLTDDLILRIAVTGGVICVPFAKRFVGDSASGIADHIDHIAQLIGNTYHIGIGSDLDGAVMSEGITVADWWRVTGEALEKRGYSSESIENITGLNTLKILRILGEKE